MSIDILVGRQPIFDGDLRVIAYELLFRGHQSEKTAEFEDADLATDQVIENTFRGIGLRNLVGDLPAFINLTRRALFGTDTLPLSKDEVVLEVLEDIEINRELMERLRALSNEGFRIALDDFACNPGHDELVAIADIVKIDVHMFDSKTLARHVSNLRRHDVKLLAEKIESPEQMALCRQLGFDYFQGYLLGEPTTIIRQRIPSEDPGTDGPAGPAAPDAP